MEAEKVIVLGSEPTSFTWWQILWKTGLGLGIGVVIGFLIFIILIMVSGILDPVLQNNGLTAGQALNPLIPLIFVIIAFITTFIGNVLLWGVYNLFYSTKYYDLGKMFSMSLLSNVLIFFVFTPLYLLFYNNINGLFTVLGFHILFAIFACYTHVEILTNPNYSSSHLIGSTIWVSVSALIFLVLVKTGTNAEWATPKQLLILLPSVIWYVIIPFFHDLWEKIYYKFYENGNDFLYLPTLQEIQKQEEVMQEDVTDEDITVNIN